MKFNQYRRGTLEKHDREYMIIMINFKEDFKNREKGDNLMNCICCPGPCLANWSNIRCKKLKYNFACLFVTLF